MFKTLTDSAKDIDAGTVYLNKLTLLWTVNCTALWCGPDVITAFAHFMLMYQMYMCATSQQRLRNPTSCPILACTNPMGRWSTQAHHCCFIV